MDLGNVRKNNPLYLMSNRPAINIIINKIRILYLFEINFIRLPSIKNVYLVTYSSTLLQVHIRNRTV